MALSETVQRRLCLSRQSAVLTMAAPKHIIPRIMADRLYTLMHIAQLQAKQSKLEGMYLAL